MRGRERSTSKKIRSGLWARSARNSNSPSTSIATRVAPLRDQQRTAVTCRNSSPRICAGASARHRRKYARDCGRAPRGIQTRRRPRSPRGWPHSETSSARQSPAATPPRESALARALDIEENTLGIVGALRAEFKLAVDLDRHAGGPAQRPAAHGGHLPQLLPANLRWRAGREQREKRDERAFHGAFN